MPKDTPLGQGLSSVDCEVIHKETANSIIVKTTEGERFNMETNLPDVQVGHRGKLVTMAGKTLFVRQPYE